MANVFLAVSENPVGEEFMLNFLLERWEEILESLVTEHRAVEKVIKYCSAGIRSKQQIDQLKNLQKNGRNARNYGFCTPSNAHALGVKCAIKGGKWKRKKAMILFMTGEL
ncbi:hypothetical protein TELCIR_19095, partial [Teladorsagia circumcincta]